MADKDFAQLQATVKPEAGGVSNLRAAMLVVGILFVVMMSFVGGYWLGSRQGHESAETAAKARLLAQLQAQQKELQALRQQANRGKPKTSTDVSPTTEVGDLTFYTDLPKQPVKPEPLSQPASPQMPAPTSPTSQPPAGSAKMVQSIIQRELDRKPSNEPLTGGYYVQAASFQDTKAVADMQRKLQAMDLNTAIRRVDIPGRGTWYRLLVGPYASHDTADAARVDLGKKMHLKGIVIRDGG